MDVGFLKPYLKKEAFIYPCEEGFITVGCNIEEEFYFFTTLVRASFVFDEVLAIPTIPYLS